VVCLSVFAEPQRRGPGPQGLSGHEKKQEKVTVPVIVIRYRIDMTLTVRYGTQA
jgi:hypothetical protein